MSELRRSWSETFSSWLPRIPFRRENIDKEVVYLVPNDINIKSNIDVKLDLIEKYILKNTYKMYFSCFYLLFLESYFYVIYIYEGNKEEED